MNISDFKELDPVIYIPNHADGPGHPDCEKGIVTSINESFVFVRFRGSTSQACRTENLHHGH